MTITIFLYISIKVIYVIIIFLYIGSQIQYIDFMTCQQNILICGQMKKLNTNGKVGLLGFIDTATILFPYTNKFSEKSNTFYSVKETLYYSIPYYIRNKCFILKESNERN